MRTNPPAIAAARADRAGLKVRHLIWIVARDGSEPAPVGFWTGDDHEDFDIDGVTRTYLGAGTALSLDPVTHSTGIKVRQHRMTLSGIKPEVEQAMRGYDPRFAPVQIHQVEYSPLTSQLLAAPRIVFDGQIDGVAFKDGPIGSGSECQITALSNAVFLTRPLYLKRSDESLRARRPNDGFMRFAKIAEHSGDVWGAKR